MLYPNKIYKEIEDLEDKIKYLDTFNSDLVELELKILKLEKEQLNKRANILKQTLKNFYGVKQQLLQE